MIAKHIVPILGFAVVNINSLQKTKTNLLILNDGRGYQNWGIQALFDGLMMLFKNCVIDTVSIDKLFKKYSIEPYFFKKRLFNENSRIQKKLFSEFLRVAKVADELDYYCNEWIEGRGGKGSFEILGKIKECDIVIFNGEGSTYRNNVVALRCLFILYLAKVYFKKKSFFLNGSITLSMIDATLPGIIDKIFPLIDGVFLREPISKESVEQYTKFKKSVVVPDSVFALPQKKFNSKKTAGFAFSLSMLPMQRYPIDDNNPIIKLLSLLKLKFGKGILLAKDIEDQYLDILSKKMDLAFFGPDKNYSDVEETLSKVDILVSGRYHHLIFALRAGCPIVPLRSSSHKIDGLTKLFEGLVPKVIDPSNLRASKTEIEENIDFCIRKNIRNDIYQKSKLLGKETEMLRKSIL